MMNIRRFTALYLLSFGLYLYYWYYMTLKNLRSLNLAADVNIRPGWRTVGMFVPILNIYLLYDLFRRVDEAAVSAGHTENRVSWWSRPGWLTAWYFLVPFVLSQLLGQAFAPFGEHFMVNPALIWVLMPLGALVTLVPCVWVLSVVQQSVNVFMADVAPGLRWSQGLTAGQVAVTVGGMTWFAAQVTAWHLVLLWAVDFLASLPQSY